MLLYAYVLYKQYTRTYKTKTNSERVTIATLPTPTTSYSPRQPVSDVRNVYAQSPTVDNDAPIYESAYDNSAELHDDVPSYELITDRAVYEQPRRFTTYAPKLVATQDVDEYRVIGTTRFDKDFKKVFNPTVTNFVEPPTSRVVTAPMRGGNTKSTTLAQRRQPTAAITTTAAPRTTPRTTITPRTTTTTTKRTTQPATTSTSIRYSL